MRYASMLLAFVTCLAPLRASAQPDKDAAPLVGTWLVVVDGLPETRTLIIEAAITGERGAALTARYGITSQRQTPVEARITGAAGSRRLELTTQASATLSAAESADGSFIGAFVLKSGRSYPVTVTRISEAQLAEHRALRAPAQMTATATAPSRPLAMAAAVEAPLHEVGDTWAWSVRVKPQDRCTNGINPGAKLSHVVTARTNSGYVVEVVGPREGTKFVRAVTRGLTFPVQSGSEISHSDVLNFPIQDGKSWNTTLVGGDVVTTLKCEASAFEKLKLGPQELDVAPIVCRGTWKNLRSGSSDQATYKYWYSPHHRNVARWTVFTYLGGATCADIEYELESTGSAQR